MFKSLTFDFYFSGPYVLLFLRSSSAPLFDFAGHFLAFILAGNVFVESPEHRKTGVQLGRGRRYLFKFVCTRDDEKKEERVLLPPFCRRPLLLRYLCRSPVTVDPS